MSNRSRHQDKSQSHEPMDQLSERDDLIMDEMLDGFIRKRDVDYLDESHMIHYVLRDNNVMEQDVGIMIGLKYYTNYTLFTGYNLLAGPVNIILDHAFLIWIALMTRFVHLVIDLGPFSRRALLKNITTCLLGVHLFEQYLRRISMNRSLESSRTLIYATLLTFALLANFNQRSKGASSNRIAKGDLSKTPKKSIAGNCIIVFAPLLINEYYIHVLRKQHHNYLRGILMTLAMKVVSQLYSTKHSKSDGLISNLTYLLHPASCISGLWHTKLETRSEIETFSMEIWRFSRQIYRFVMTFIRTFFVLVISTNMSELIYLVDSAASSSHIKLVSEMYLIAQEFRFSHYFSCLLFKSLFNMWEEPHLKEVEKLKPCEITNVEWPRSLLQVVTSWNIPMHIWLKDYVFKPIRQRTSTASAIFFTYLISSLLHGFKFHIWMVLLTLGLLTWIEYHLRLRLATKYSACILAQECRYTLDKKCTRGHKYTVHYSPMVRSFNFSFKILAMTHLAYLGYIFLGNTDEANYQDVIRLWSELSFFGHFLAAGTYIISLFV